jgi:hypothetical protein
MDTQTAISQLEKEWELETGFLGQLRMGVFDPAGLERLEQILQSIEIDEQALLPRRFVSLTWYIPLFMDWQREWFEERGGDEGQLGPASGKILGLVQEILGVP